MAESTPESDVAARRGKRASLAIFVAFAAAFILSSTWQIWSQVFGVGARPARASGACVIAAESFEEQIDRALTQAARMHSPESARDEFESALQNGVGLSAMEKKCVAGPADRDTYVAAVRLRDTARSAAERQSADLSRVRRALEAQAER